MLKLIALNRFIHDSSNYKCMKKTTALNFECGKFCVCTCMFTPSPPHEDGNGQQLQTGIKIIYHTFQLYICTNAHFL